MGLPNKKNSSELARKGATLNIYIKYDKLHTSFFGYFLIVVDGVFSNCFELCYPVNVSDPTRNLYIEQVQTGNSIDVILDLLREISDKNPLYYYLVGCIALTAAVLRSSTKIIKVLSDYEEYRRKRNDRKYREEVTKVIISEIKQKYSQETMKVRQNISDQDKLLVEVDLLMKVLEERKISEEFLELVTPIIHRFRKLAEEEGIKSLQINGSDILKDE